MPDKVTATTTRCDLPVDQMDCWEFVSSESIPGGENEEIPSREPVVSEYDVGESSSHSSPKMTTKDWLRKTGVAVAGGTMVGVGLIMIPLPTPFGCVVAGSGMAVLGTEFPAAQRVLDQTCKRVADAIEFSSEFDSDVVDEPSSQLCANDKMKEMLHEQQKRNQAPFKYDLKKLGKRVAPVIRKIGDGIDKDQLARTSENVLKVATEAKVAVQTQLSKCWSNYVDDSNKNCAIAAQGTKLV